MFQCEFAAPSPKPTRFLTSLDPSDVGYRGLHKLDEGGRYLGPLPKHCPHGPQAHQPLVGKDEQGRWMTAPSATYPPELCKWIASIAWPALLRLRGGNKGKPWETTPRAPLLSPAVQALQVKALGRHKQEWKAVNRTRKRKTVSTEGLRARSWSTRACP